MNQNFNRVKKWEIGVSAFFLFGILTLLTVGTVNFKEINRIDVSYDQTCTQAAHVKKNVYTFRNATSFNQPLNKWDVSKVVYMGYMFWKATLHAPWY